MTMRKEAQDSYSTVIRLSLSRLSTARRWVTDFRFAPRATSINDEFVRWRITFPHKRYMWRPPPSLSAHYGCGTLCLYEIDIVNPVHGWARFARVIDPVFAINPDKRLQHLFVHSPREGLDTVVCVSAATGFGQLRFQIFGQYPLRM